MALIATLLSLLIEHFLGSLEELRRFGWSTAFARWVRGEHPAGHPLNGPIGVLVAIGLPVLLVSAISNLLGDTFLLLGFIFAVLVLLYSFGPRDLEAEVEAYLDAVERGDEESARWYANSLLEGEVPEEATERERCLMEAVLVEVHERMLGVLFWFVVLGPTGALGYRLACYLRTSLKQDESPFADAVRRLHDILAWIPVRLCALSYSLSGSFVEGMHRWREQATLWDEEYRGVLVTSGEGALNYQAEEGEAEVATVPLHEAVALARRAVFIWLTALALLTLAGWLS